MNKYLFNLIALAAAQTVTDIPKWSPVDSKYTSSEEWPSCVDDSDCEVGHYCLDHMWGFNHETFSGTGCWREEVCSGYGSFIMYDD